MKKKTFGIFALTALLLSGCSSKTDNNTQSAQCDTIIYGTIFVGEDNDKTVEAVVVKDGIIIYAGNKEGAKAYEAAASEVIQLADDKFVLPGIVDAHTHPAVSWDNQINALMLKEGWNMDKYIEEITSYVKNNPGEVVYRVKGFIESEFKTAEQKKNPKAILDAIVADVPIVATDAGGHGVWCNSKAIEMVSKKFSHVKMVDKAHPGHDNASVPGGTIERNSKGEAIGFFRDKGTSLVNSACVEFTKESYIRAIVKAQEEYASLGYTAYNEAMINESADPAKTPKVDAYKALEADGKLLSYVSGSFIVGNREDTDALVNQAIKLRDETKGGNFEVTDIKIFMDGVVEGGSAYLSEPYKRNADGSEAGDYKGSSGWSGDLDKLTKVIIKANEAGMAVHFHAIGDQAIMDALTCIENAAKAIGIDKVREARNVITHLQIVDESSYEKFAKYNVIANLNPWANKAPGFYNETEVMCLGENRAANEYPYKTFLDKGINCSFGTDYGSSFTYHFNESFLTLTARKYATVNSPEIDDSTLLNASEAFTPVQALNIMCAGGSYQLKKESKFGMIKEGMEANLVIMNANPLTAEEQNIMKIMPLGTMFEGKWVYKNN